ncbi:MAG: calcium-binding protein [Rhizobiaceae bacterium]|nr:calcium-binding protein [Rhizobiaceae bacterium]MCV0405996.1 calcium-binding protein [Rhizobiaceae bacterium]
MLMASTIAVSAGYSFAQSDDGGVGEEAVIETDSGDNGDGDRRFNREPIDLERFSRMEELTEADLDGDGTLSREELEAEALAQIVRRAADRMERRLDINGDGTVTLAEIEDYRARQFAALDRDGNGTLERGEMRQMKQFRDGGSRHGHRGSQRFHRGPRY